MMQFVEINSRETSEGRMIVYTQSGLSWCQSGRCYQKYLIVRLCFKKKCVDVLFIPLSSSISLSSVILTMSQCSSVGPTSKSHSTHWTPPPSSAIAKKEAKHLFGQLFDIISACMAMFLNSKTPEVYQTNGDALMEPLVHGCAFFFYQCSYSFSDCLL